MKAYLTFNLQQVTIVTHTSPSLETGKLSCQIGVSKSNGIIYEKNGSKSNN
jgi:hypothetical protein